MAFYAAEAGFNRARARLIRNAATGDMMALNHRTEILVLDNGGAGGTYVLRITPNSADGRSYTVVSTGTYGTGALQAKRVVSGSLVVTGSRSGNNIVTTIYDP